MKKILRSFIVLSMLPMLACGSGSSSTESSTSSQGSDGVYGMWMLQDSSVDEFGDEKNDDTLILKSVSSDGDFSNTATASSELTVAIFDWIPNISGMKSVHLIQLRLLEYNKTPATYYDSSKMSFKMKVNDKIEEYGITGTAPNGDLYIGLADKGGDVIHDYLYYGNDIRCIVYIDNSQYNFTIYSSGFANACADAEVKLKAIQEKNRIKTGGMAIKSFFEENEGSEKIYESYTWLTDNYDSLPLLTTDEIKEEIQGEFLSISMNQSKKDVPIVTSYWNIMNYANGVRTQEYYFKEGKDTTSPEKTDFKHEYTLENNLIKEKGTSYGKVPYEYQVRKVADGYYILYWDSSTNYSTPAYILIKYDVNSEGFSPKYSFPE